MSNKVDIKSQYKGDVTITFKRKDKNYILKKHNNGLITLSKAFALFISNSSGSSNYIPQYLDLQYIADPSSTDVTDLNNWTSYLKKTVSLSGLTWEYVSDAYTSSDTSYSNYVAKVSTTIPYSYLVADPKSAGNSAVFRFFLLSNDLTSVDGLDSRIAYIDVAASELDKFEQGTEAQISWQLQLIHDVNANVQ